MAITVGLALAILIGFLGLVVDLGHMYVVKAEMQNAMDACALAAAKELTGTSTTQLQLAENAGITVGSQNNVNFQSQAVAMTPADITFASAINGAYQSRTTVEAAGSAQILSMKFAKCEKAQSGIAMYFMKVLGMGSQSVPAHAVATLQAGQTSCPIPLGMCSHTGVGTCAHGGTPNAYGLCPGEWYDGKLAAGGGYPSGTGNFNWIDFTPPSGGASELAGLITGTGSCNSNSSNTVGQSGVDQSVATAWNSRFGLYKNGGGNPSLSSAPPDYTGYAYTATSTSSWPQPKYNAYADFKTKRAAYASYGNTTDTITAGNTLTGLSISNSFKVATHGANGQLASNGASRRIALAPIVDCSGWASSQTVPIKAWACVLMLHPIDQPGDTVYMEFLGLSDAAGSPCATTGLPGTSTGPLVPALVR